MAYKKRYSQDFEGGKFNGVVEICPTLAFVAKVTKICDSTSNNDIIVQSQANFSRGLSYLCTNNILNSTRKKLFILPDQIACYQRTETVYIVDNRVLFKIALPDSPHSISNFKSPVFSLFITLDKMNFHCFV